MVGQHWTEPLDDGKGEHEGAVKDKPRRRWPFVLAGLVVIGAIGAWAVRAWWRGL